MDVSVDGVLIFTLSDIQKKVIQNDIPAELLQEDLVRRLPLMLLDKYAQCFKRLKSEWDQKFIDRKIKSIPTDPDEYAALVFSQPDYQDRSTREKNAVNA